MDEELATLATGKELAIVNHPVSLVYHTLRSNFDGLLTSAPALLLISGTKVFIDWATRKGADGHLVHCGVCIAMVECQAAIINWDSPGYMRARAVIGKHLPQAEL
jgi:hypothetical protein